jgi:hypothetical protein
MMGYYGIFGGNGLEPVEGGLKTPKFEVYDNG